MQLFLIFFQNSASKSYLLPADPFFVFGAFRRPNSTMCISFCFLCVSAHCSAAERAVVLCGDEISEGAEACGVNQSAGFEG